MLQKSPLYAYLPARNLDRARRFYEETPGFVPKSLNNGDSGGNILAIIQTL